ncbi:MAG: hypothetical protein Phyf2KO_19270 [Phycisphaerales bacterium]
MPKIRTTTTLVATIAACLLGCEETGSGSAGTSQNQGGAQSQLGKSVDLSKELQNQIQARDLQTGTLADTISGGEGVVQVGNVSIPIPSQWAEVTPSNSMRIAQYEAENGEVVIALSQAGGSVEANIQRWQGQVKDQGMPVEPEIQEFNAGGFPVTVVELTGDYTEGGMMGTPTTYSDYTMLAAIIDTGATKAFVKITGPFSLVADHKSHFENMIRGIQRN